MSALPSEVTNVQVAIEEIQNGNRRLKRAGVLALAAALIVLIVVGAVLIASVRHSTSEGHKTGLQTQQIVKSQVLGLLTEIHNHQTAIQTDTTQLNDDRAFQTVLEEEIEVLATQITNLGGKPQLLPLPAPTTMPLPKGTSP